MKYAFTLTPANGNERDVRDIKKLEFFENELDVFFYGSVDVLVKNFEQCKKGKSKGKYHCHGIFEIHDDFIGKKVIIDNLIFLAKYRFGGKRPLKIDEIYNEEKWLNYCKKEEKKEENNTCFFNNNNN